MPARRDETGPLGVVYTPPALARAMVEGLLGPLVKGRTADEILRMRVCDPAMGDGAFLVEVVRYLAEQVVAASQRTPRDPSAPSGLEEITRHVALHSIVGVDIDPASVTKAMERLSGLVGRRLVAMEWPALRTGDALTLDWPSTFPRFDAVIANPPYIRQESLSGEAVKKAELRRWQTYDGVADLYVYFIELAHDLLETGGRYAVVAPNKWMTAAYARQLRAFLAKQNSVDAIVDLSAMDVFDDADAFACVLFGTIGADRAREIKAIKTSATDSFDAVVEANAHVMSGRGEQSERPAIVSLDRSRLGDEPWHIDSPEDAALLARMKRECTTLGGLIGTRWSRGVVTGCNDAFVIDETTRDALLEDGATADLVRPFAKGRDIRAYALPVPPRWILLVDRGTPFDALPPAVRAHLETFRARLEPRPATVDATAWAGRKPGAYAWHELQDPVVPLAKSRAPRMLYQDIQTAPLCALDLEGEIVPDTTVWILPSEDRVLLAILNSPVYRWIAQRRFPPALNGAVRPKLQYMQQLPIPRVTPTLRREITMCVEQRIAEGSSATRLDSQLGMLVMDAYELSRRERALVQPDGS